MGEHNIGIDKEHKMAEINEMIKFKIDDTVINKLIFFLASEGSLVLDCPNCGLTVIPQAKSGYAMNGENEQKISCVGCNKSMTVRMYPNYGFVLLDSVS